MNHPRIRVVMPQLMCLCLVDPVCGSPPEESSSVHQLAQAPIHEQPPLVILVHPCV